MKLAVAGKGGVGKTSVTAWLGDYLARLGREVWLVDADTALSLGQALGIPEGDIPVALAEEKELIKERVGDGFINLNPMVADLPDRLRRRLDGINLLVMGSIASAGAGCACNANSLLKALLAHVIIRIDQWVIIDLEAGVEHLGRGTVKSVDGLIIVSDPSIRSLQTAARINRLAGELGLARRALLLNRADGQVDLPTDMELPPLIATVPTLPSLRGRQLRQSSVLNLEERDALDGIAAKTIVFFERDDKSGVRIPKHLP